jgi:protocatechuate 3,4-dioxygenase, beta subunit
MPMTDFLIPTSEQDIGPYYPMNDSLAQDGDLTRIEGTAGIARGQIIHLSGRVLDPKGAPIPDARVEIWQANTFGRYAHPGDSNPAPLDPHFEGHGVAITGSDGAYRFTTVKPAAYPTVRGVTRAPHIHFMVTAGRTRLVTQMYFDGEPLNETDELLGRAKNRKSLIAAVAPAPPNAESQALIVTWDVVLSERQE